MSRTILIGIFAALLAAGSTRSASAIERASWAQTRLACADIGVDPSSSAFDQCVFDLYYSLWNEQNEFER